MLIQLQECKRLWCKTQDNFSDCRSSNLPWADGTPCKSKNHWCQKGECVPREGTTRQVINGGWGSWSHFTPCSMTCGGGVQESQRECNNPLPQNGGKYCAGSRKKYRSCNTFNCLAGSLDPREQQCYDMNGMNFDIRGIDTSVTWVPKYGCKLAISLLTNEIVRYLKIIGFKIVFTKGYIVAYSEKLILLFIIYLSEIL